jgi:hypothetical protein
MSESFPNIAKPLFGFTIDLQSYRYRSLLFKETFFNNEISCVFSQL